MSALTTTTANNVRDFLKENKGALEATIPKHVNADRLMRVAVQAIAGSEMLAKCSKPSLITSIIRASMLGIEPNGPLAEGYLVPYGKECQLIIGYRGLINLARLSGIVSKIYAHVVYLNDDFDYEYGLNPFMKHKPASGDRGAMVCAYAVYHTKDGESDFEVMSKEDIMKVKAMSRGANSQSSPWNNWEPEMWKKTVIRRLSKRMPMSVEMAQVVNYDNDQAAGKKVDNTDIIDIEGVEIPTEQDHNAEIANETDPSRSPAPTA